MKKLSTFCVLLCLIGFVEMPTLLAQEDSPWPELDASPMDMATYPSRAAFRNYLGEEGKDMSIQIRVLYSRPRMKGRTIFGELVSYGKEWRLGANEATEIYFAQPVEIGGSTVPQGYYTLHAQVEPDHWTVRVSTQRSLWGSENRDHAQDIASVKVMTETLPEPMEDFSITFQRIDDDHCNMVMAWASTQVKVPIDFNPIIYAGRDVSPVDLVQYPNQSRFHNYLKAEEIDDMSTQIRVTYARPQKNGRDIFGGLIKYGDVWRIGANESTEISLYQNVKIGDQEIDRGRYAMYAKVNEQSWDIILSTDLPAWGSANRDTSKDVAHISVPVTTEAEVVEALSIIFKDRNDHAVDMIIAWDKTRVTIPIAFL